ncbi:ABC transporter permease [Actinophytocola oryzae]|uniref:Putative ABC transport system permease protein n=1 Tax=Actinophytocola oryzae TaxID=502181 RepID=A0A4R7W403_9PSEU|nr:ABC transporter permease [Actinophytocola oryzae]TDV57294.1 putative ABC transport system permease protein [Actinophytocola oryzae]
MTAVRPVRLGLGDVLRLGLLGITARRFRAALSALGIAIGIATMIVVTGIPATSQRALLDELTALGTNMLRAEPTPGDPPVELSSDAVERVARIGPVTGAAAVANTHTIVRRSDRAPLGDGSGLSVLASTTNLLSQLNGTVADGRFLDASTSRFPTVVLGYVAAGRLGIDRLTPNQAPQVYIGQTWFTVIGILAPMPLAADVERAVLVGWDAARTWLEFTGHPTVVYAKARENAIEDVRAVLAPTLYPRLPGLVQVSRPSDALAAKRATENNFSALLLGLAGVALLVGGIGVANTMFISVLERRREIGLRRALGATRSHIRSQFLTEAVALSTVGGAAGTATGALVTAAYALYQDWQVVIPPLAVLGGVVGAIVVGAVAGLHPSIRASRLTPTEALAAA